MSHCSKVEDILVAFARGERLKSVEAEGLRTHTALCAACQRRLTDEYALSAAFAALATDLTEAPLPGLEDLLRDAFRRQGITKPRATRGWRLVVGMGLATAAAFLIGIAWIGSQHEKPVVSSQPQFVAQERSGRTLRSAGEATSTARISVPAEKAVAAGRQQRHTPRSHAAFPQVTETATDFIRLPYTDSLLPTEQAEIFRVQMPEAALATYGLPIDGSHLDSRVYADVLVGQDGTPRAIRFVH